MTLVYLVVYIDGQDERTTVLVCADEETAKFIAQRFGGSVEQVVFLPRPELD